MEGVWVFSIWHRLHSRLQHSSMVFVHCGVGYGVWWGLMCGISVELG